MAGSSGGYDNRYPVAALKLETGLGQMAVDGDMPVSNELLGIGSGEFGTLFTNILIKADALIVSDKTVCLRTIY